MPGKGLNPPKTTLEFVSEPIDKDFLKLCVPGTAKFKVQLLGAEKNTKAVGKTVIANINTSW